GAEALTAARQSPPTVVILDLMLPGMDGLEVCRALRADPNTASVAVIMVTARAEETDRIVGLEIGADDYIAKPFSPNELVARVRALLRRTQRSTAPAAQADGGRRAYGRITIDTQGHIVAADGQPVTLTAKEFLL